MLWITFGLSILMYAFMTFVSYRPGIYKWRMTENNVEQQYILTSKMARTVKAFMILAFIVLTIFLLMNAQGLWTDLTPFLFIILFTLIISPCLYYAVKFSKVRWRKGTKKTEKATTSNSALPASPGGGSFCLCVACLNQGRFAGTLVAAARPQF